MSMVSSFSFLGKHRVMTIFVQTPLAQMPNLSSSLPSVSCFFVF